jgi:hypothetical protein
MMKLLAERNLAPAQAAELASADHGRDGVRTKAPGEVGVGQDGSIAAASAAGSPERRAVNVTRVDDLRYAADA